jgi:hypothetical protein
MIHRITVRTWRRATRKPRRELARRLGTTTVTPAQRKAQMARERRMARAEEQKRRREAAAAKKKAAAAARRDKAAATAERRRRQQAEARERERIRRMKAKGIGTGRVEIVVSTDLDKPAGARLKSKRGTKLRAASGRPPRPGQPAAGVQRVQRVQGVAARREQPGRGAKRPVLMESAPVDPRWAWDEVARKRKKRKIARMLPEGRKSAIPHFGKRRHDPNGVRNCPNCKGYGLVNARGEADKHGEKECPACAERRALRKRAWEIGVAQGLPRRRMRG